MCFTIASPSPVPRDERAGRRGRSARTGAARSRARHAGAVVGDDEHGVAAVLRDARSRTCCPGPRSGSRSRRGSRRRRAACAGAAAARPRRRRDTSSATSACSARSANAATTSSSDRQRARAPERDDLAAGLELAEEEHVVDQVARLLDLLRAPARRARRRRRRGAPRSRAATSSRASGVRSSCETAAVNPARSSW